MLFRKGIDIFLARLFMVSKRKHGQIFFVAVDLLQGHIERKVAGEIALAL